jgi:hypothetical protein
LLLASSNVIAAAAGSDLNVAATTIVDRCYAVWTTVSDSDLVRLEDDLRRELRAEAASTEAQADSAEAEIALLEGRLALLHAGFGENVADAAARKTVGAPTHSAIALGASIVAQDAADAAAEIAAVEAERAEAQGRLNEARLQQLRMPGYESGLQRCIDYHRARMASAAPVPAPAPAPAPVVVSAPAPQPAPAPAPAPAAAPEPTPPPEIPKVAAAQGWEGTLTGWYEGECVAQGTSPYEFRQRLRFDVDEAGTIEGRVWWGSLPQRAGDPVTETTARSVSGLVDAAGTVMMSTAWKGGTLAFDGQLGAEGAAGTMLWKRPFETCRGLWTAK